MSIQIGVNFEYKGELSNFARDSFETLRDMRNILDTDIDEGHISYCIETGKHYVFNKNNTIDVETAAEEIEISIYGRALLFRTPRRSAFPLWPASRGRSLGKGCLSGR